MGCASLIYMPWRPPKDGPELKDSRLDPYRDRAAVLREEQGIFATISREGTIDNILRRNK